ncbi:unnamed protein product, partial [Amoebophrya sp. A25]|eukprot:GSA25T00027760001.1
MVASAFLSGLVSVSNMSRTPVPVSSPPPPPPPPGAHHHPGDKYDDWDSDYGWFALARSGFLDAVSVALSYLSLLLALAVMAYEMYSH